MKQLTVLDRREQKIGSGNDLRQPSPLYSPIINFIRQIARTATMDHCILRPLYPLFSPCQWSLTALRTISDIEDEDEEKSGENRRRPRAQLRRIDKARERGNNTGTAAGSSEGGLPRLSASSPRLASVVTRRECAITALRTRWRWRGFQAHVGLRLSSWQFTVFARSLARLLVRLQFEPAEPTDRPADLTRESSSVFLSRVIVFFFFPLTFLVPSDYGRALSSPRWYLSLIFCMHLSRSHSPARSLEGEKFLSMACLVRSSRSSICYTWFTSAPSQCRE